MRYIYIYIYLYSCNPLTYAIPNADLTRVSFPKILLTLYEFDFSFSLMISQITKINKKPVRILISCEKMQSEWKHLIHSTNNRKSHITVIRKT